MDSQRLRIVPLISQTNALIIQRLHQIGGHQLFLLRQQPASLLLGFGLHQRLCQILLRRHKPPDLPSPIFPDQGEIARDLLLALFVGLQISRCQT